MAKLAARSIVACRRLQHFLAEKRPTGPTIERVTIGLLQRTMRRVSVTRAGFGISNANLTPIFIKKFISCANAIDYQCSTIDEVVRGGKIHIIHIYWRYFDAQAISCHTDGKPAGVRACGHADVKIPLEKPLGKPLESTPMKYMFVRTVKTSVLYLKMLKLHLKLHFVNFSHFFIFLIALVAPPRSNC